MYDNHSFLSAVATDLYSRYGERVSDLNIVFPSRRAQLFFSHELAQLIDRPLWQPTYTSIEDLLKTLSTLKQTDDYSLLVDLYKVYVKHKQSTETFDHFYFWGEILLKDFDTIDKYLANAEMLFKNLAAQKVMEGDFSFLSDDQIAYIQSFWSSFDPKGESILQHQFIEVWAILYPVYHDFRTLLATKGKAYEGMIYRDVAERIGKSHLSELENNLFIFVGFNALNECEKRLFRYLKNAKQAEFYWDYDDYYINNTMQEAGYFMRNNIIEFPMPESFSTASLFKEEKEIGITSVPSDVLQAKMIPALLHTMNASANKQTAIVLADENLLLSVLHSLPEEVEDVNITMGYPLKQTPVYSLAELLIRLQHGSKTSGSATRFYHKDVTAILNHRYIKLLASHDAEQLKNDILQNNRIYIDQKKFKANDFLQGIFTPIAEYSAMSNYLIDTFTRIAQAGSMEDDPDEKTLRREYIYTVIKAINQLKKSIDEGNMTIGLPVFLSLLRNVFSNLRIPFTGEPIKGLQIMGLLETRSLDFENLIILSLNEGILPHAGSTPSFIPYHLRHGFNIPATEQQEAIYAYYFYRLLQRAKKIQLLYSSKADDVRTGEMSRYLYQLKFESGHEVKEQSLGYQINFNETTPIIIEKNDGIMALLRTYQTPEATRSLSPSALSSYIKCPLQFYFRYIARLSENEEIQEDVKANVFGSILHRVMEGLYKPYIDQSLSRDAIMAIYKNENEIRHLLNEGFALDYYHYNTLPDDFEENGNLMMTRDIIHKYVKGILLFDAKHAPFTPLAFEKRVEAFYPLSLNGHAIPVKLSGYVDRIDRYNAAIRIVDYKTGTGKGKEKRLNFKGVESLFLADPGQRNSEVFQTFLYALMYSGSNPTNEPVTPALYFVRDIYSPDFDALVIDESNKEKNVVTDFAPYASAFTTLLNDCLVNLFNPLLPFTQTDYTDTCTKACAYCSICKR